MKTPTSQCKSVAVSSLNDFKCDFNTAGACSYETVGWAFKDSIYNLFEKMGQTGTNLSSLIAAKRSDKSATPHNFYPCSSSTRQQKPKNRKQQAHSALQKCVSLPTSGQFCMRFKYFLANNGFIRVSHGHENLMFLHNRDSKSGDYRDNPTQGMRTTNSWHRMQFPIRHNHSAARFVRVTGRNLCVDDIEITAHPAASFSPTSASGDDAHYSSSTRATALESSRVATPAAALAAGTALNAWCQPSTSPFAQASGAGFLASLTHTPTLVFLVFLVALLLTVTATICISVACSRRAWNRKKRHFRMHEMMMMSSMDDVIPGEQRAGTAASSGSNCVTAGDGAAGGVLPEATATHAAANYAHDEGGVGGAGRREAQSENVRCFVVDNRRCISGAPAESSKHHKSHHRIRSQPKPHANKAGYRKFSSSHSAASSSTSFVPSGKAAAHSNEADETLPYRRAGSSFGGTSGDESSGHHNHHQHSHLQHHQPHHQSASYRFSLIMNDNAGRLEFRDNSLTTAENDATLRSCTSCSESGDVLPPLTNANAAAAAGGTGVTSSSAAPATVTTMPVHRAASSAGEETEDFVQDSFLLRVNPIVPGSSSEPVPDNSTHLNMSSETNNLLMMGGAPADLRNYRRQSPPPPYKE